MIELIKKIINTGARLDNEILLDYRNVFNSREGRRVLTHMLMEMRYFDSDVLTDEGRIMRNYATRLIQRIGGLEPAHFVDSMVTALMKIPLSDKQGNIDRGHRIKENKNLINI